VTAAATATEPIRKRALMAEKNFGTTLKILREMADVSQTELAEACGIAQTAISLLERGDRSPSWKTVIALCLYFGISCEVFRSGNVPSQLPAASPARNRKHDE
jgi:DNA-binding XRE family transcriptional regulator